MFWGYTDRKRLLKLKVIPLSAVIDRMFRNKWWWSEMSDLARIPSRVREL